MIVYLVNLFYDLIYKAPTHFKTED